MPILFAIIILSSLGFGLLLPGFLFAAENLGASATAATTIVATYSIGQAVATPIWGRLSDRYGRRPMLIISMAGSTVAYLGLAMATDLTTLTIARLISGLTAGNFSVATAYVSDITPPEKRAQGMGMVGVAISIGFMIGPGLGGLLVGTDPDAVTLFLPSVVAAGAFALTLLACLFGLKESLPPEKRAAAMAQEEGALSQGGVSAMLHVLGRPVIAMLVALGFLVFFAAAMFETIMPLWTEARYGWTPREVGFLFLYLGLVVMIVQGLVVGRVAPLIGEARLSFTALIVYGFGLLCMTQAPTWQWMILGITFTAMGGAAFTTSTTSLVSQQAGDSERGLVLGLYQSAVWLARSPGMGPTMSGLLFSTVSVNGPLFAGAVLMAPSLCLLLLILRRIAARGASPGDAALL